MKRYCNQSDRNRVFNGAACCRPWSSDRRLTSIIEEAFADTNLPVPIGPTPLLRPSECQVNGLMYVVLSSHRTPKMSGKCACTVRSPSSPARWVSGKKIKVATTKCGCRSCLHPGRSCGAVQTRLKVRSAVTTATFRAILSHPYDSYVLPRAQCEWSPQQRAHQSFHSLT